MIGTGAGYSINALGSSFNTFMGINAGNKIKNSMENTFIGTNAGAMLEDGYSNTIIGIDAGRGGAWDPGTYHSFVTSQNTILGCGAGYSLDVGNGNVFIGYQAGYWETGTIGTPANNKLYISNSSGTPLIGGNFASGQVGINRMPVTNAFEVNGEASKTTAGSWLANSDARIKINISDIENAEETLLKLHPVKFRYSDEWKSRNPSIQNKYYYNFIAQEFREVFPDAVQGSGEYINGDAEELLQLDSYSSQIVAIKALQEEIIKNRLQQKEIEKLQTEIDELKLLINNLLLNKSITK
jgi:hypothetical protein